MSNTEPAPPSERVDIPAIGPPSTNTERRQSPTILAPATRTMDPSGRRRRVVMLVSAAGHLLNDSLLRAFDEDDDLEVLGDTATVAETETVVLDLVPHVALIGLDLERDTAGVIELCASLREQAPTVAIVVLAETERGDDLFSAVRAGASSCVVGHPSPSQVGDAVIAAHRRESRMPPSVARALLAEYRRLDEDDDAVLPPAPGLTATEDEVLRRLAAGESPDELAQRHQVTKRMIGLHAGYAVAKLHRTVHDDEQLRLLR